MTNMTNTVIPAAAMAETSISKSQRSNSYKKKKSQSKKQPKTEKQQQHEAAAQVVPQQKKTLSLPPKPARQRRTAKRDEVPELSSGATSSSSSESDSDNNNHYDKSRASRQRRMDHPQQQHQQQQQLRSSAPMHQQVYCGPCFSNAPPPSTLPIPAFHSQHHYADMDPLKQQSKHLLGLLQPTSTLHAAPPAPAPAMIKTAHHPMDADLTEIQRGLWSMLKISA